MVLSLKRKLFSIRANKKRGHKREKKALEWLKSQGFIVLEYKNSYHCWDFICEKDDIKYIIEHKSCMEKVSDGFTNQRHWVVHGRFKINVENHLGLLKEAEKNYALPYYLFQVVDEKARSKFAMMNWHTIDEMVKKTSANYFLNMRILL